METLIECKNLCAGYEGQTVINDLSFSVSSGDFLSIVGENGSGKTTLMKTLLGLKSPQSGEIVFGGGLKSTEIGYLPQQTAMQKDFPATVKEVVLSGRLSKRGLRPFYGKTDKARAKEDMELMDILPLADRSYRDLSGGQQQRVLLARALCATEKLLLLDEPVSGLDPSATQDMYDAIFRLNKERGVTVIMISHDLNGAIRYSKQILHMEGGQYFFGTVEEYRSSDIFHTMSTCDCRCCCNHHNMGGADNARDAFL
ncbi:MAG: metal ABC transporter ATP-binding protein [Eubacterium sp.]|nr:metal ABC transporter ATP-binding protein [Eubacterium sp.]